VCPDCRLRLRDKQKEHDAAQRELAKTIAEAQRQVEQAELAEQRVEQETGGPAVEDRVSVGRVVNVSMGGMPVGAFMYWQRQETASAPEMDIISVRIKALESSLKQLEEEREYYLSMCYTLMQQRHVEAHYDQKIEETRGALAKLQARWAHLNERLTVSPEEAAARDETARRLLEG
jgi:hypothetical protein